MKRSYSASELRPYRVQVLAWIKAHGDDQSVRMAVAGAQRLYRAAGTPVEAFRLPGRTPAERASAIWAQLRKREVDPMVVVAAWLAVGLRLRDDPQPDSHDEYRQVQAAKLIHRMAGGTHKRWETERHDRRIEVTELHKYPVSRGRVLRILGRQIASACAPLIGMVTDPLRVSAPCVCL